MSRCTAIIALCTAAATCLAQTGTYTWQVSTDGINWSTGVDPPPTTIVHVRLRAGWSGITGSRQGYAGGQFDVTLFGATDVSSISNIVRPSPFAFAAQTLVAFPIAGGLKIDTAADIDAPGAGTGWVNPGQAGTEFGGFGYSTQNPATIFTFDIVASGNVIVIGMVLNPTTGRAMAIYPDGLSQVRLNSTAVTVNNAFIGIPAPTSIALMCLSTSIAIRRRRVIS